MSTLEPDAGERFFDLAASSDVDGALALVRELLDAGVSTEELVTDVVAPAQQRVGLLWASDTWSVAQEHAATAVVDAVVGHLQYAAPPAVGGRGRVAVVCAEGEWHALPARLVAVGLRTRGWEVVFLGGSVPAPHLARSAQRERWDAAVVSCSVPMFLAGAQRSTAALHAADVPVLAAGGGFGPDRLRADRLGADGWAADLAAGVAVLDTWMASPPEPRAAIEVDPEAATLEAALDDIAGAAMTELTRSWPRVASYTPTQLQRTREDLGYLLRFLHAAVLTDDDRILSDYLGWLEHVLTSRSVPGDVVPVTVRAVQAAVPPSLRRTHDLLLAVAR